MLGPVLEGEQIRLAPARTEYLPEFIRWFSDMSVTKYLLAPFPMSLQQEEDWFQSTAKDKNTVHWAILLKDRPIGVAGVHKIDWISRSAHTGTVIGVRDEWGKGYASEAVRLRTAFAFNDLNLERLETESFAVNAGMHTALERSGYRKIGTRTRSMFRQGQWHDLTMFELLRSHWLSLAATDAPRGTA